MDSRGPKIISMKILVFQDDFPPESNGGAGMVAYVLSRAFIERGHTILVVAATQDKDRVGRRVYEGVTVERIYSSYHERWRAWRSLYNPSTVGRVRKIISAFQPDIVHVHNIHMHLSYAVLPLARKHGARGYMTAHDGMSFSQGKPSTRKDGAGNLSHRSYFWEQLAMYRWRFNPLRNPIIRRILQRDVDTVIAVSDALKRALNENGIRNVVVIHNGIEVNEWKEPADTASFKQKFGIGNAAILFGGRLSGAKGAIHILDALDGIRRSVPEAQLLVVAKKEGYAKHMIAHAEKLGIADRLVFTGWLSGDELRRSYYASSVVAVPSLYLDPFPTINLEAFACKKPVVATCFGGSPEIVEDGVSGYVVDPFDIPLLSEKICDLLADKEKNVRFGIRGYERVIKEFSSSRQAQEYERTFAAARPNHPSPVSG